jgi:hypothetical protein
MLLSMVVGERFRSFSMVLGGIYNMEKYDI